jgi:arsenate reductase
MGCGVKCPYIGRAFDDGWGLEDPTGKPDSEYLKVIAEIRRHLKAFGSLPAEKSEVPAGD